ncbi:hypothetical protein XPA_007297 [Xanthoria parietina]
MTASSANPPHPRSTHLTDPLLLPFLAPSFSATAYLNTTLPPPPTKTPPTTSPQPQPTLSTLASQTQSQISTLSAQTSRLSATLTALTDDILRSSSRLTYEIELLRGEANGLVEALTSSRGSLNGAIRTFIPSGLHPTPNDTNPDTKHSDEPTPPPPEKVPPQDHINNLRTLHHVRHSLTTVTQTFSLALTWPMPPSLLPSTSTSLISITSPSSQSTLSSLESSGQAALAALRREIEEMVVERGEIGRARARVKELRDCVGVWRGTSEERARGKWVGEVEGWVEGLAVGGGGKGDGEVKRKMGEGEWGGGLVVGGGGGRNGVEQQVTIPARTGSGAGFLRRLREEIYMD